MEFPFLTDAFLNALQDTGAATPSRGWGPVTCVTATP